MPWFLLDQVGNFTVKERKRLVEGEGDSLIEKG